MRFTGFYEAMSWCGFGQRAGRWRGLKAPATVCSFTLGVALLAVLAIAVPASATGTRGLAPPAGLDNRAPESFQNVGIDQRLGEQVPLDLAFRDEQGRDVTLGEVLPGNRPVILVLGYYECPMLCTLVLNNLVRTVKPIALTAGKDYDILSVSFNPKETAELAAAKKENYLRVYTRPGAENGWHFLTGSQASIDRLTDAVGFHYTFDERTEQYIHPSGIMVLTPEGKIAKYFYGVEYQPKDVRLALVEAADSQIGTVSDQFLLRCYHYDATSGRYTLAVSRILKVASVITLLGIGSLVVLMIRRERRGTAAKPPAALPGSAADPSGSSTVR